jgi:hypothetical protein
MPLSGSTIETVRLKGSARKRVDSRPNRIDFREQSAGSEVEWRPGAVRQLRIENGRYPRESGATTSKLPAVPQRTHPLQKRSVATHFLDAGGEKRACSTPVKPHVGSMAAFSAPASVYTSLV